MIRRFCNHISMVMVSFRPSSVLTSAGEETCTQRRVDMISLQALLTPRWGSKALEKGAQLRYCWQLPFL